MIPAAQPLPQTAADIPQRSYAPMKDPRTGLDTTNAECAHCRKSLFERDIIKQPQCGHLFHAHCIDSHLRSEICCPVCKVQLLYPAVAATVVHDGRAAGSVYPAAQLPPRAVPVATAFAPVDGTDARDYAACRECGQMFYRDPTKVRPETNGWYRCQRCAQTDIIDLIRGSFCVLQ
ncbi:RNA binding protein [Phytophthora cinnamomi]|uniref:RNA binding protein n=1 Tax=Phytophthora cinnamomi TaxID=4785 RepID=UPI003559F134|nr:RNA binding protein [Phytophthora cinnamomi]